MIALTNPVYVNYRCFLHQKLPPCLPLTVNFLKRRFGPRALRNQKFSPGVQFFFFFRRTLLMLNEMDFPSYWKNNKLSVRIWQHMVVLAERALAGIIDILGLPPLSAWLGPERPQISHESLGIPIQAERAVYTTRQSLSGVGLFATPWTVCSPAGSSAHGILQVRTLQWVATSSSRGSS